MLKLERSYPQETPLVVGVGGGGCHLETGSIAFRMIKSTLEDMDVEYKQIHGCDNLYGDARVVPPSQQRDRIEQIVETTPGDKSVLLLGQCMGGCAIISFLREYDGDRHVNGVIFAPATQPDKVVTNPQSRARRHANDTIMRLNILAGTTRDYRREVAASVDAVLPPEYLSEAFDADSTMEDMAKLVMMGRLSLWAAGNDWNPSSPADVARLQEQCGDEHIDRLRIVPNVGHTLHLTNARHLDEDTQIAAQKAMVETMVRTEVAAIHRLTRQV